VVATANGNSRSELPTLENRTNHQGRACRTSG
jgi:hypothetical protein